MERTWQERISEVSKDELLDLIKAVSPDDETYFGKKFLTELVNKNGLRVTLQFIKNAKSAIEDYGGLDLNFNFDVDERKLFWKTHLNYAHFNELCEVYGWSVPGGWYVGIHGILKGIITYMHYQPTPEGFDALQATHHHLTQVGDPLVEILIGAALFLAGIKNRKDIGLEHLKDTINELSKEIPKLLEAKQLAQAFRFENTQPLAKENNLPGYLTAYMAEKRREAGAAHASI